MLTERPKVKYPIGIQDFEKLRREGYIYVDKTRWIYELVDKGSYFFLARPRRFGKSLLMSTLKAFFEGKKELFEGLAIHGLENDWKKYPVLMLELSRLSAHDTDSLKDLLNQQFSLWEKLYCGGEQRGSMASRFADIIIKAHETTGERVIILVDEYDNALINTLHNPELHEANKELLKSVYSNLKALDAHIHFAMLTGVSRFSHVSIFSGLNNIKDISFDDSYGAICGITYDEILNYFQDGIRELAKEHDNDQDTTLRELKRYYDGYHFSKNCPELYNPFSLLNAFQDKELRSYWMRTATPTFLVKRLMEDKIDIRRLFNSEAPEEALADTDLSFSSPVALLFQTGYLTIKGYDREWRQYRLGIPNKEVEEGLFQGLLDFITENVRYENSSNIKNLVIALREGCPGRFMETLQGFMAGIGYPLTGKVTELYFENNLYIIFKMIGFYTECEVYTSSGRIGMVVKTHSYIYLFEFKLDGTVEDAVTQIEQKGYAMAYASDGRKVYKIGVNFSSRKRNIDRWLIKD